MPVGEFRRRGAGQNRGVVVEHLRVRQQPRRDDRLSRAQVLIDLERRVRAARTRRDEHVGGEQIRRNLRGRTLAGKDRRGLDARGLRLLAGARDLVRLAAGQHAAARRAGGRGRRPSRRTADRDPDTPRTCRCRARAASPASKPERPAHRRRLRGRRLVLGGSRCVLDQHRLRVADRSRARSPRATDR